MDEYINSEELAAAEQAAKEDFSTHYTHTFLKPMKIGGHALDELVFDWDSLTGADSLAIENEMQALGRPVIVAELSGEYLIRMAARACVTTVGSTERRIGADDLTALPVVDYNRIRARARSFLLGTSN